MVAISEYKLLAHFTFTRTPDDGEEMFPQPEIMQNRRHGDKSGSGKSRRMPADTSCRAIISVLLSSVLLLACAAFAQTAEVSQVKAAYLYNFTKYIEWPPDTFHSADDPAVICVIGDDRTGKILEQVTLGRKANGRPVQARNPRSLNELRSCQVLFIGFEDKERITGILRNLHDSRVLVVGQTERFLVRDETFSQLPSGAQISIYHDADQQRIAAGGLPVLLELRRSDISSKRGGPSENSDGHYRLQCRRVTHLS